MICEGGYRGADAVIITRANSQIHYTLNGLGKILAASDADVGSVESCVQVLTEMGIRAGQIPSLPDFWLRVRIVAVNERAMKYIIRRSLRMGLQ